MSVEKRKDLKTLAEIKEINNSFPYNRYVKQWKENGGKTIGWFCTYTPEELIYAAGILPVRVWGGFEEFALDKANSYFYPTSCPTVRATFQLLLEHNYDFLDGFVVGSPCEHARRFYDVLTYWKPMAFNYISSILFVHTDVAINHYYEGLLDFKAKLEQFSGVLITDDALWEAIHLYNRTRELLRQLNELRKLGNPPISGAEDLEIMNACLAAPKEQFNKILERLIDEVALISRPWEKKNFRLMITGSMWNNPDFLKFIEDQGCLIVANELCTGMRYWADSVEADSDPLKAIARRYVTRFPCHHFYPWEPRIDRMVEVAKAYRVDGVIDNYVRYCIALGFMRPLIRTRFEKEGIPYYDLEQVYNSKGSGQVKTRVQAFLEMIEFRREED